MHDCYMGHSCNVLTDTFLKSLLYEGAVMHTVGILAWATAYIAVSKHEARKLAAQDDGAVDAQRLQQAAAAFEGGASKGSAGVKHTVSPSCQSPRSVQWSGTRAALNGEPPRSAGASDQGPSAAEADRDKDLVPFETLGINFLRTLGLGPALCWMDERVAKLADRIDETIVLRSACLPVAAYSLTYTHLARVQFMVGATCFRVLRVDAVAGFVAVDRKAACKGSVLLCPSSPMTVTRHVADTPRGWNLLQLDSRLLKHAQFFCPASCRTWTTAMCPTTLCSCG